MKRFSQSLTAVAMASALALGGATVAQAQVPAGETAEDTAADPNLPAPATKQDDEGNTWYQSTQDPSVYVKDANQVNEPITDQMRADYNKAFGAPTEEGGIPAPATKVDKNGNTCYQHLQDPTVYVKDRNQVNEPITDEMRAECVFDETTPGSDNKKLAWLALPAALIIGGIIWHLANDGKTYVQDENSKAAPSEEEKAASDKMLTENKDEVIAQGGQLADQGAADQSASDRGMLAQTGSNTAARGLAGLAVIAMIAAGAFAVRRKLFA
ncbi:putative secreted protein [Corynebacterium jeikeium]|uniref:Secreted protein n=1 Tax=Corynebacterium jeikeium (strain K411) TaxID=306537 RepID=Q4JT44_CORJK|nr:hypothetical protein [Corynebacterium jeikeium]CAI38013.1 hypothetical protein jk1836 [Corynebacterium jeikeium K411]SUY84633.1 putative secreted protein [Corynebacterium jeikeium]